MSSPSQALDEARLKAIADARRKAEIYAKAAGVTLGKPVAISEGGAIPLPVTRSDMTAAMATIVSPGEQTLSGHGERLVRVSALIQHIRFTAPRPGPA